MKKIFFWYLVSVVFTFSFAQQNVYNSESELQKFIERGGKVEETAPNIFKLIYPEGISRIYNFNLNKNSSDLNLQLDTAIINIGEIDTTKFNNMFTYWQTVRVSNMWFNPVVVDDINGNSLPEIYGFSDRITGGPPPWVGPVKIYERNLAGNYQNVFTYDSLTMFVQSIGNIDATGNKELVLRSLLANNGVVVYKSDSLGMLPTNFDFIFYYQPNQINDMFFGDYDRNEITDCAFIDASNPSKFIIAEFRDSINNFVTLYEQIIEEGPSGFAIGDFDLDAKTELIISTGLANVFVIENVSENQYSVVNEFPFPYLNAYMQTVTDDIDKNGKPEFWIGGRDFTQGITMYQCYEAIGNNSYIPVARIELRYSVSFTTNYIQAVDIDDDRKEEIIISSGNRIIILKFIGSPGEHHYELWYAKLREATQPGAEIYPVTVTDLNGDQKKDLLVPFNKVQQPYILAFSYILKQDTVTGILPETDNSISEIHLSSHPNPFNMTNNINIELNETSDVQLKIYNTLGEEINLLLDKELLPGKYSITWDALDKSGNSLPSGVYLIVLNTKEVIKAIKSILIK